MFVQFYRKPRSVSFFSSSSSLPALNSISLVNDWYQKGVIKQDTTSFYFIQKKIALFIIHLLFSWDDQNQQPRKVWLWMTLVSRSDLSPQDNLRANESLLTHFWSGGLSIYEIGFLLCENTQSTLRSPHQKNKQPGEFQRDYKSGFLWGQPWKAFQRGVESQTRFAPTWGDEHTWLMSA